MGYQSEFETLAGVFEAGWNGATPIAWGNLDFTPVTPLAPWVRFSVLPGEAFHATAGAPGANIVRHPGLITVQVFVPLNSGSVEALGLGLGLPGLDGLVSGVIAHAATPLDQILNSVLSTLGIGLGQADSWVTGVRCGGAVLVR